MRPATDRQTTAPQPSITAQTPQAQHIRSSLLSLYEDHTSD
ncbi:hypothetical protein GDO78_010310 [Eleutherodactylus coqui]|uniref:Uncharacterized protein n=1 Tax=Eleutherodactylus coqui TaxID=57060 RepID=A0A8J6F5K5_ELECQ|nr:hypothetical protein GDO78_010310 [Eleutherodactylus coqui]